MRTRTPRSGAALALAVLAALAPAAARGSIPPSPLRDLLARTATPAELQSRLRDFAGSHEASDRATAGEAWLRIGQSFEIEGETDSAVAAFQRAAALRGDPEDHLALAEALLRRGGRASHGGATTDAARAASDLAPLVAGAEGDLPAVAARLRATWAAALLALGHPDSAARAFETAGDPLLASLEWRVRWARAELAAGRPVQALPLVYPAVVRSWGRDSLALGILRESARAAGAPRAGPDDALAEIATRRVREARALAAWGARRVGFRGAGGDELGGALLPSPRRGARAVVVIAAPGDTLADYDSLAVGLGRAGCAVLILEPRGSGASASATWPRPESWAGRDELLARLTAADLHAALRLLAGAGADTSRPALGGVGASGALAIRVAAASPRTAALLLVSPTPRPAEWAPLRARLAASRLPVFFQLALEEHWSTWDESDVLFQGANQGASRVVESRGGGRGAAQFREDPDLMPRLTRWLAGLRAPGKPSPVPPRPRRRRG